jgi:hypothetical protein
MSFVYQTVLGICLLARFQVLGSRRSLAVTYTPPARCIRSSPRPRAPLCRSGGAMLRGADSPSPLFNPDQSGYCAHWSNPRPQAIA